MKERRCGYRDREMFIYSIATKDTQLYFPVLSLHILDSPPFTMLLSFHITLIYFVSLSSFLPSFISLLLSVLNDSLPYESHQINILRWIEE